MNDIVICLFAASGFDKAAQGLTGEGRRLADQAGSKLCALVLGNGAGTLADEVAAVADSVIVADQDELSEYQPETYLAALTELCREQHPVAVLLSSDTYSQEIAPRLAHRLGGQRGRRRDRHKTGQRHRARNAAGVWRQGTGRDRTQTLSGGGVAPSALFRTGGRSNHSRGNQARSAHACGWHPHSHYRTQTGRCR